MNRNDVDRQRVDAVLPARFLVLSCWKWQLLQDLASDDESTDYFLLPRGRLYRFRDIRLSPRADVFLIRLADFSTEFF